MELIQITAQYSNAVLVAILPHVSDFADKLNLPILAPVTTSHVLTFKCDPRKEHIGGFMTLTNGYQFTFLDGRVCVYRSPQSYYSLQDPSRIPEFYGPTKVGEREAIMIARNAIRKLGYEDRMFHAENSPLVTPPEKIGTNSVARYRLKWTDPNWRGH